MAKLENNAQYEWAVARVEELLPLVDEETPRDDPAFIELSVLSNLVADYSDEHFDIGAPSLAEMIRLRMYEMGLTQVKLAELIGVSASRVSEYLSGKSEPTLRIAKEISAKLDIDPALILGV